MIVTEERYLALLEGLDTGVARRRRFVIDTTAWRDALAKQPARADPTSRSIRSLPIS